MQLKTTNVVNLRNDVVTLQQTIATAKRCDSAKDSLERVLITMLWLHSPRSVCLVVAIGSTRFPVVQPT